MHAPIFRRRDAIAGAVLALFGLGFVIVATGLDTGTLTSMGPGMFPMALGAGVLLWGCAIVVKDVFRPSEAVSPPPGAIRALLLIMLSVGVFTVSVESLGLLPAVMLTVLVSALASSESRPATAIAVAIGLAIMVYLIFIAGLGMQVDAFNWSFF